MPTAPTIAAQAVLEERKGTACLLVGGTYRGCNAWFDKEKDETACQYYLIVNKDDGYLKLIRVNKESVGEPMQAPVSYIEAAFQQHQDLGECMDKLVKKLAQCRIDGAPETATFFRKKLDKAYGRQILLGSKAVWKMVEYGEEEVVVDIDVEL
jgi:hypothetical protein